MSTMIMGVDIVNTSVANGSLSQEVGDPKIILKNLEYRYFLDKELPVIVYLILLSVTGLIGNAHALIVYSLKYKRSNHRTFVIWLAVVDLIASCLSLPFETFDIRYSFTFSVETVCKIFREINYFVGVCSGFLLGIIAIERYRKACKPTGRQINEKEAIMACFVTVVFAVILSVPSLFMYGLANKQVNGSVINGTECTVLDSYRSTFGFQAYNFVMLVLSTTVFILCIIIYSFVGKVLFQQIRFRKRTQTITMGTKVNGSNDTSRKTSEQHVHDEESSSVHESNHKKCESLKHLTTQNKPMKKNRRFSRNKQITFMFLIATAVSYFWYLPHLTLTIIKSLSKSKFSAIELQLGSLTDILIRTYFVSNVTNPIVYCLLDTKFRTELKNMYRKFGSYFVAWRRD